MTALVLSAVPVPAGADRVGWRFPLEVTRFDRRSGLLEEEAEALAALGPRGLRRNRARGLPRRTAPAWRALARLVEPLDAARAVLHHADDVRYRRAGSARRRDHPAALHRQRPGLLGLGGLGMGPGLRHIQ
jgi:hypothetical protein